jgi:hypothetical protein
VFEAMLARAIERHGELLERLEYPNTCRSTSFS